MNRATVKGYWKNTGKAITIFALDEATVVVLLLVFIPNGLCMSTTSLMRIWKNLDLFLF